MKTKFIVIILVFVCNFNFYAKDIVSNNKIKPFNVDSIETYCFDKDIENLSIVVDNDNNIVLTKTVNNLDLAKENIYNRALSYIIQNYNDAKSVIQQQDKEAGIIISKGVFNKFYIGNGSFKFQGNKWEYFHYFSASHILRIDIKEGRVRINIILSNYEIDSDQIISNFAAMNSNKIPTIRKLIVNCSPIDNISLEKRVENKLKEYDKYKSYYTKYEQSYIPILMNSEREAFKLLIFKSFSTITNLENSIKEKSKINSEDW